MEDCCGSLQTVRLWLLRRGSWRGGLLLKCAEIAVLNTLWMIGRRQQAAGSMTVRAGKWVLTETQALRLKKDGRYRTQVTDRNRDCPLHFASYSLVGICAIEVNPARKMAGMAMSLQVTEGRGSTIGADGACSSCRGGAERREPIKSTLTVKPRCPVIVPSSLCISWLNLSSDLFAGKKIKMELVPTCAFPELKITSCDRSYSMKPERIELNPKNHSYL